MCDIIDIRTRKPRQSHETLADLLLNLERALGLVDDAERACNRTVDDIRRIVIKRQRSCWSATFHNFGDDATPDGVAIPLPFTPLAHPDMVADDLLRRYPGALIITDTAKT